MSEQNEWNIWILDSAAHQPIGQMSSDLVHFSPSELIHPDRMKEKESSCPLSISNSYISTLHCQIHPLPPYPHTRLTWKKQTCWGIWQPIPHPQQRLRIMMTGDIVVMTMMIWDLQTANCNPIVESRQNRQLQRSVSRLPKFCIFEAQESIYHL